MQFFDVELTMTRAFYHDNPDTIELESRIIRAKPGAVLVEDSPFFPGGGGQLADRGTVTVANRSHQVTGVESDAAGLWHMIDSDVELDGMASLCIDSEFRNLMCELHTLAHIANAIVFQNFGNPLLTGAQLADNGTLRLDFDLPGADNAKLRALEPDFNDAIKSGLEVNQNYMSWDEANAISGMFRSKTVAPPRLEDGMVRIVNIAGLDQQACGGTHLKSTDQSRPVKILKVENKGRQNRRLRLGIDDS